MIVPELFTTKNTKTTKTFFWQGSLATEGSPKTFFVIFAVFVVKASGMVKSGREVTVVPVKRPE
jgi:hypothetical protein